MYYGRTKQHEIVIRGQKVIVDSMMEGRIIRKLDDNGFNDRWLRPKLGLNDGDNNYTPDLELSIDWQGTPTRAIVELKPTIDHFKKDIARRMIGIKDHYKNSVLLLYIDKGDQWYRLDPEARQLIKITPPLPGVLPINKLPKPLWWNANSVYNHHYKKRIYPRRVLAGWFAELLEEIIVGPKKSRRPRRGKRRR